MAASRQILTNATPQIYSLQEGFGFSIQLAGSTRVYYEFGTETALASVATSQFIEGDGAKIFSQKNIGYKWVSFLTPIGTGDIRLVDGIGVLSSGGGSATSATAQYSVTYPVYDTTAGVNLIRQDNISISTGLTLSTVFIGTDGVPVAAPTTYTIGHRDLNSDALLSAANVIKNTLIAEDFAQEATLADLNTKIIPTAKGIKTKAVITDGLNDTTVRPLTNANPLDVSIVDALGNQITTFGLQPGSNDISRIEFVTNGIIFAGIQSGTNNTNCLVVTLNNSLTVGSIEFQVDVNGLNTWRTISLNNRTLGTVVTGITTAGVYSVNFGNANNIRFRSPAIVNCPVLTSLSIRTTIGNIPDVVAPATVTSNANTPSLNVQATVTTGGVAQQILPLTPLRKGFEIQNNSNLDLRVAFGSVASTTNGFIIKANEGSYSSGSFCSTSAVSVFGATTAQAFTYIELT